MISKQKILSITAILLMLGTVAATGMPAYAQSNGNSGGNFFSGLIQFLSQKFGLDQTQVKSAVTEYQTQKKTTMQQNADTREKKRLDALVTSGKITKAQEDAINAERMTLRAKYNPTDFKSLTADQRKKKMTDEQNEINAWAKSQGIDPKYVIPGFGKFPKMGMRRFDRHSIPNVTPTP